MEGDNMSFTNIKTAQVIADEKQHFIDTQYQRDRIHHYPKISELVVALYDEDDHAAMVAKRAEVKAKYPKPE
jgi:hypothetical protein